MRGFILGLLVLYYESKLLFPHHSSERLEVFQNCDARQSQHSNAALQKAGVDLYTEKKAPKI